MARLTIARPVRGFSDQTLLIARRDPGEPIVWTGFLALLLGLAVTFHLPRRRVWARSGMDGRLDLVGPSDRQVDFDRELGNLDDALVEARGAPSDPPASLAPPAAPPRGPAG